MISITGNSSMNGVQVSGPHVYSVLTSTGRIELSATSEEHALETAQKMYESDGGATFVGKPTGKVKKVR